ncbi:response regulator [Piscinibacter sp.]|uniref:response regulator n=1 Tax=Piscinibacter sp. TaxID=1903157 RepID=UPI002C4C626C|nr:response regulator [Albitalea sp.]HUG22678.1 response regulator [Albitalea sp.]
MDAGTSRKEEPQARHRAAGAAGSAARPTIGMFINWLTGLHRWQWLGAADSARAHGANLICFSGKELGHPDGFYSHASVVFDLVKPEHVDGLIVWTTTLQPFVGRKAMEAFCHRFDPLPMVSVEQTMPGVPSVLVDEKQGMREVVNHLIEVHGHRRIAFIRGPVNHPGAQQRYLGYVEALARHGIAHDPALVSPPLRFWRPEESAAMVETLLDRLDGGIDAIATANDDLALGAAWALQNRRIRVPADIAVVGFDDAVNIGRPDLGMDTVGDEAAGDERPRLVNSITATLPLTTVRSPIYQLAWRAVEVMLSRLRGEPTPLETSIPTQLVLRRSCGCLPPSTEAVTLPRPAVPAEAAPSEGAAPEASPRDRLAAALRQALAPSAASPPGGWAERLVDSFVESARGDPARRFLFVLDELVHASARSAADLSHWWSVLFGLRRHAAEALVGGPVPPNIDELWQDVQRLMWEWSERFHAYEQAVAEKRDQIVRHVGQKLITTLDIGQLTAVLVEELPTIGVTSCYMALYEPGPDATGEAAYPTPRSRAILVYERGRRIELAPDAALFPSHELVPGGLAKRDAARSLVVLPLYFQDKQLGFVVMEGWVREGWIYEALRAQLSSAVQGALLVEREKRALIEVDKARARAEEANQAKSTFLATMSHELRTPLNGILGYAKILQNAGGLTPLQANGLRTIQLSGEHLLALINDILDLSKIDAAKLELAPSLVELPAFIRVIADIIRVKTEEKDILFELDMAGLPQVVLADERRLRQVLLNLLGNAVKFTDAGTVSLRIAGTPGPHGLCRLRFVVADTGIGLAPGDLELIFHAFEQVGDVGRRVSGSGLGLAISRQLVRLMGADIHVDSRIGAGSAFSFELTVPTVTLKEEQFAPQGTIRGYEGPRRRVLVVDDVDTNRTMLVDLLAPLGFDVSDAADGEQALERVRATSPDLVLMDVVMPVMDGLEATRRLRGIAGLERLPIVALSANASPANRADCLAAGASAFLSKPIDHGILLHELRAKLGLRWLADAPSATADTDDIGDVVLPPADELAQLHHLAQMGNMREIRQWADRVAAGDPRLRPVTERFKQLADGYRSKAILALATRFLRR